MANFKDYFFLKAHNRRWIVQQSKIVFLQTKSAAMQPPVLKFSYGNFEKSGGKTHASCKLCSKKVTETGSTTTGYLRHLKAKHKNDHGIAQVTMGSVGFLANIISSSVAYVGFTLPAFGIGFWGGIFLVVSGALAIVAANRTTPTRGLVMAFYIMDILAAVASGIWTLLAVIVISTDGFFYWVWLILLLVLIFCGLGGLISNIMSAIFIGKVMGGCSGMNNGAIGQPAQAYQVQSQPVVTYQSQPQPVMSHQLHADNRFNLSQQNQENSGQAIQNQSGSPPAYSKPHWQTTQQVPNQYHHQPNSTQQNSALAHSQTVPSAPPLASHQPIQPARQAPSRPIRLPSQSQQVMAAHGGRYEQPLPVIPGEQSHHYDALDLENQRYEGESGGAHDIKEGVEYDGGFDHGYLEPME